MLPDFRFIIGAALATFMLGVTALGLVSSAKLARQAAIAPLEASHSLAFVGPAEWDRFYDPDTARRLAIMARQEEALRAVMRVQAPTGSLRGEPPRPVEAPPPPEPQAVERRPAEAPGPPLPITPVTDEPSSTAAVPTTAADRGEDPAPAAPAASATNVAAPSQEPSQESSQESSQEQPDRLAALPAPPTPTEAAKPDAAAPEVAKSDAAATAAEPVTSKPPASDIVQSAGLPLETTEFGIADVQFPPTAQPADEPNSAAPKPAAQKPPARKRIVRRRPAAAKFAHRARPAAAPATAQPPGFTSTFPQTQFFPPLQPTQLEQPAQTMQAQPAQTLQQPPAQTVRKKPAQTVRKKPAQLVPKKPAQPVQKKSAQTVQKQPAPPVQKKPAANGAASTPVAAGGG